MSGEWKRNGDLENAPRCAWSARLDLYHDGEMDAREAELLRVHLERCRWCSAELERMRRLSNLIGGAWSPRMPAGLPSQAAAAVGAGEAVFMRTARVLAAVAAVLLIVCSVLVVTAPAREPAATHDVELEAATLSAEEPADAAAEPDYELARWMVADLSGGEYE